MTAKVLLIEDDETFVNALRLAMQPSGTEIVWAPDGAAGASLFKKKPHDYAAVVIDYVLPDMKGSEVCRSLRRINPEQEILFASGHQNPEYLTDILETGTAGFLVKGRGADELRERVLQSVDRYEKKLRVLGRDNYSPTEAEIELRRVGFVGRSKPLYTVLKEIERYLPSPYRALIVGETGVGKELVANALVPAGKKLVAVNCASFRDKENLLEAELFGYVKGAFTGAERDTAGLVMQAHNNVLFLDELHQLSISAQAKLFRFLQEMKFRRVGDTREITVDFKLIAAVQPDIRERVKDGRFTEDLIRRVSELVIQVPPLRERVEDIEPLVRFFQDEYNAGRTAEQRKQFRIATVYEMAAHAWPGNIRELRSAVRKMLTDCAGDIVNPQDFRRYLENDVLGDGAARAASLPAIGDAREELDSKLIKDALGRSRTRSEAAKRLGMPLSTFSRKTKELGINAELHLKAKG